MTMVLAVKRKGAHELGKWRMRWKHFFRAMLLLVSHFSDIRWLAQKVLSFLILKGRNQDFLKLDADENGLIAKSKSHNIWWFFKWIKILMFCYGAYLFLINYSIIIKNASNSVKYKGEVIKSPQIPFHQYHARLSSMPNRTRRWETQRGTN